MKMVVPLKLPMCGSHWKLTNAGLWLFHSNMSVVRAQVKKVRQTSVPCSKNWRMLWLVDNSAVMVDFPGVNPHWASEIKVLWAKCWDTRLYICLSNNLLTTARREMGLLLGGSSVLVEDLGIGTTDEVSNMRYRLKFGDDFVAQK